MDQGLAVLEDARRGQGRLLLIAGEAGIGKSRLADELARRALECGFLAAWGRCWEAGGAPPYWPWVQTLRSIARGLTPNAVRDRAGAGAEDIAQLLPEMHAVLAAGHPSPSLDADTARFRLFDATTTFLRNTASSSPLLVVLDDLQVADVPSLLLLQFLAGALQEDRLLVVGTYRGDEVGQQHPLAGTLRELARHSVVRHLALRGLPESDVRAFMEAESGVAPHESVVHAVRDETEGNPLFLREVTHLLLEEGRLDSGRMQPGTRIGLPPSVRDVIRLRTKPLGAECVRILTIASVLGREFSLEAIGGLTGLAVDTVVESIDDAFTAGVITDLPGSKDRLRFSHVIIRESLYEDLARSERMQMHRRAGDILESLYGEDLTANLAEVAHHFFEGADEGHADKAVAYACRAAEHAMSLLAFEEAARLYTMALGSLRVAKPTDQTLRCDVMLQLGHAQALSGDHRTSKRTFLEAADLARRLGAPQLLARAALGYGGRFVLSRAGDDPHLVPLLRDSIAEVGTSDSALRARLLARIAGALRDEPSIETRAALSREAVDLARRLGDAATLAYTLEGLFWSLWTPDNPQERLDIAGEMIEIGEQAGDLELVLHGHEDRRIALFELADVASMKREIATVARLAQQLRQPTQTWLPASSRALTALFEGRFEDAEALILEARDTREWANPSDAREAYVLQLFMLRREQGRLAEIEALVRAAAREIAWYPVLRCTLALLLCETARDDEARIEYDRIAADDFVAVPFDNNWLFSMSLLSEVTYALRDEPQARRLYERLLPFAERNAAVEVSTGSLSRSLGLLTTVMSTFDAASGHYERALEHNREMGARPWVAHTEHDFAVMLAQRRHAGDAEHAVDLLRRALASSESMDMPALRAKVKRDLDALGSTTSAASSPDTAFAAHLGAQLRQSAIMHLEGEYWTIGYDGRVLRLRDSKGVRVLAVLLSTPGRPHPSVDLERLGRGDEVAARAMVASDAGELLDDEARRAYRARLRELQEAIAEAAASGAADSVATMVEERDFLLQELGRAVGLGGRSRRAGSVAERARLNVTRAVKTSVRRIAVTDPVLGAHLDATVHTGAVCVYTPDPRSPLRWNVAAHEVHIR